jgi:hypothetical protein
MPRRKLRHGGHSWHLLSCIGEALLNPGVSASKMHGSMMHCSNIHNSIVFRVFRAGCFGMATGWGGIA